MSGSQTRDQAPNSKQEKTSVHNMTLVSELASQKWRRERSSPHRSNLDVLVIGEIEKRGFIRVPSNGLSPSEGITLADLLVCPVPILLYIYKSRLSTAASSKPLYVYTHRSLRTYHPNAFPSLSLANPVHHHNNCIPSALNFNVGCCSHSYSSVSSKNASFFVFWRDNCTPVGRLNCRLN